MTTKVVAHTPGPWHVEEHEDGHIILMGTALTSRAQHEVQHSIVYDHGLYDGDDDVPASTQWAEAEANARLIAAAPDLYAACHALVAGFGTDAAADDPDIAQGIAALRKAGYQFADVEVRS